MLSELVEPVLSQQMLENAILAATFFLIAMVAAGGLTACVYILWECTALERERLHAPR